MNFLLLVIYIVCLSVMILSEPSNLLPTLLEGSENTLKFLPVLFATYSIFIPLTKVLEKGKVDSLIAKGLLPINKRLFPNENEICYNHLSINLSTNMLGIGGASTPSGILAVENMKSVKNKIMLVVINSLSIQIIPTTVIAMRAVKDARINIILPTLATTIITAIIGVILVKVFVKE